MEEEEDDELNDDNEDEEDNETDISTKRDMEIEVPAVKSGSTAVVALLRGNQIYVANVGDSGCVICRDGG